MGGRENEWTDLMKAANAGDNAAYDRLLRAVAPVLRAATRRGLARAGQPGDQAEDIVQDILFAAFETTYVGSQCPVCAVGVRHCPQ